MALDMQQVAHWLDEYVAAWKSYDPHVIGELFSEDVQYKFNPFDTPLVGRDALVANWLHDQDEPGTYDAKYRPLAVNGDLAVVQGRTQYFTDSNKTAIENEFDNIFVLRFDADGRCVEFCEWYFRKPR